jgi:GT2 family glycosyltransferase
VNTDVLVLCTRNRPDEVRTCLQTVRTQTHVPDRVIVVDSSDDDATRDVVRELAPEWPHRSTLEHQRCDPPLTRQRSAGIDASTEDIVHFIDDDTVLEPGYFTGILDAFAADEAEAIGGVGGFVTNRSPYRVRCVDRWLGLDSPLEGVVLPSGRNTGVYSEPHETIDVDWLSGCAMSFRRRVFEKERPNLAWGRDRNGEDVELSYRMRQHWRLVVTPKARMEHHNSPRERRSRDLLVRIELVSRYERVIAGTGRLNTRAFWISAFGQLAWYGGKGLVRLSGERLAIARNTAAGIRMIWRIRRARSN